MLRHLNLSLRFLFFENIPQILRTIILSAIPNLACSIPNLFNNVWVWINQNII